MNIGRGVDAISASALSITVTIGCGSGGGEEALAPPDAPTAAPTGGCDQSISKGVDCH
ncbi:MAG: hypothetical protein PVH41_11105 [Anaerolineae bacterium]|jgi:hypothetical protein